MRKLFIALMITVGAAGCSSGNSSDGGVADLAKAKPPDMAVLLSSCGKPGDTGNSVGVGKFCNSIAECTTGGMKTNICSAIGNGGTPSEDDTYFCTVFPCHPGMDATECGENATCSCGGAGGMSGCGCVPNSCLGAPPDGGDHD